eukprot:15456169-Alexandrium_andersonii.AAC.1
MLQTFWGLQESAPNVSGLARKVLQTAPAAIIPLFLHLGSRPNCDPPQRPPCGTAFVPCFVADAA